MGVNKESELIKNSEIEPENNLTQMGNQGKTTFSLTDIQNELKVPKGNFNDFAKFKYRSAEDILEAVKPILKSHKATLTLTDNIVVVGDKLFCKATARLGNYITNGFAELSEHKGMSREQTTGTASSYARKYALNGMFLIDETESDPDNTEPGKSKEKPWLNAGSTEYQKAVDYLKKEGATIKEIEKTYKLSKEIKEKLTTL